MIKLSLKLMAFMLVLAATGCGQAQEPAVDPEAEMEFEAEETDLSDEELIEIMAHSSYLSMELQEDFEADPAAATEDFEYQISEVTESYGVSLEELETNPAYEAQWNNIMADPQLQQQFQQRMAELEQQ